MNQLTKKLLKALAFSATLISWNTLAEVRLELGEGINLLAINGEEVESDSFFESKTSARLESGTNQILVNYTAEIKPGDDSELEVTQPSVLLFTSSAPEIHLKAPEMKSARDIAQFEESLNWSLTEKNGKNIPYKANLLIKKGLQLSRDYEDELEEFNMSAAEAALPKRKIISTAKVNHAPTADKSQIQKNKNMAMDMLIYWYNQADDKTRRSFKELISN